MKIRQEYRSETGKMEHIEKNTFRYGQAIVTKYIGLCRATLGDSMSWEEETEAKLIDRIDRAGYGK